jgi:hypothetical protein
MKAYWGSGGIAPRILSLGVVLNSAQGRFHLHLLFMQNLNTTSAIRFVNQLLKQPVL